MCNCWNKTPVKVEIPPQSQRFSKEGLPIVPKWNKTLPEPKEGDKPKFCRKCYYEIKRVQIIDPSNSFIIEKYICSNPNCPLHS